jgi:DNA-directed RNA polymerase subunit RPC12/RpoP
MKNKFAHCSHCRRNTWHSVTTSSLWIRCDDCGSHNPLKWQITYSHKAGKETHYRKAVNVEAETYPNSVDDMPAGKGGEQP